MKNRLNKIFGIKTKSSFRTEIFAGLAAFLATAYILTINPNNINAVKLLNYYKAIYFDGKYYFEQKASMLNANPDQHDGRTNWTKEDFFDVNAIQIKVNEYNDDKNYDGYKKFF